MIKRTLPLVVIGALLALGLSGCFVITSEALPTLPAGHPARIQLSADGGVAPLAWTATGLPAGLALDPSTGIVAGIPMTTGTFEVSVSVTDAEHKTQKRQYPMVVDGSANATVATTNRIVDPVLSADGRFLAFISSSRDLPGGDGSTPFAYVTDRQTGSTVQVAESGGVEVVALSTDGRTAAFDRNRYPDQSVWVWDRPTQQSHQVSDPSIGAWDPSLSGDGTSVAYVSYAASVPHWGIAITDRTNGATTQIVTSKEMDDDPAVSADGSTVVFESWDDHLVAGDTNQAADIFAWDRSTGALEQLYRPNTGSFAFQPAPSADGRYVAFWTFGADPFPNDGDNATRVLLWDREKDVVRRVSPPSEQEVNEWWYEGLHTSISADGRFVSYRSFAPDRIPGISTPGTNIFVWDRDTETTVQVTSDVAVNDPAISADGRSIAYSRVIDQFSGLGAIDVWTHPGS